MKYVHVVINNKSKQTDLLYTYKCREDSVCPGNSVIIGFGKGNKRIHGYVFQVMETKPEGISEDRIKYIEEILDQGMDLTEENIQLCQWMKERYFCRYIDAIKCFIPRGASLENSKVVQLKGEPLHFIHETDRRIFQFLQENTKPTVKKIKDALGEAAERRLIYFKNSGYIEIEEVLKSNIQIRYDKVIRLKDREALQQYMDSKKNAPNQKKALQEVLLKSVMPWHELRDKYHISFKALEKFQTQGLVDIELVQRGQIPHQDIEGEESKVVEATEEQKNALERIGNALRLNEHKTFLIHGVTGSGKTEIYMRLIEEALDLSKTAMVLVPEISLTLQMIERFKGRFGEKSIAILHSGLTQREKYDEWIRIKNRKAKIVIGARSSVFAPLDNLGIIIIDEEHESSYKSDSTPRYDAVEVAEKRAEKNHAVLVLGSATPLVTSYNKSEEGIYQRIELNKRYNENPMPSIDVVDMREELLVGNKDIFSRRLETAMHEALGKGKQVILFINKRGYASFVSCRSCGYVMKCPECGIALTYHNHNKKAICHYCGYQSLVPKICPECSSQYIKYFGTGTEKVEELTRERFNQYTCERLDLDTAQLKGNAQKILKDYKKGNIDILIGTQMIAKGLDFPNVGLVGILAADISLNIADYRASERTFQLITQSSGRSGRGTERGHVILQTYNPEHYSIKTACNNDYKGFYNNEILVRKHLLYPPFSQLVQLMITGKDEKATLELSLRIKKYIMIQLNMENSHRIMGPRIAPRQKIDDQYRFQILIKFKPVDQNAYHSIMNIIQKSFLKKQLKDYNLSIDINPYSFM